MAGLLEPYECWAERVVWVPGAGMVYDSTGPVPLVAQGEECVLTKLPIEALDLAGRDWEMVFTGASGGSVAGAVAAGLGIAAMIERLVPAELIVWRDPPLPPHPEIPCAIYLRNGRDRERLEDLAEALAGAMRARSARMDPREPVADRKAASCAGKLPDFGGA